MRHYKQLQKIVPLLFFALLLLSACAPPSTVRLMYQPPDASVLPTPGAPRVVVVMFDDPRQDLQIGQRRNGSPFIASAPVADWISRNLADELARQGLQVSYATSTTQARAASPDYMVTGSVEKVNIQELGNTDYMATITIKVSLSSKTGRIFSETLNSTQSQQVLPTASIAENLLSSTLHDLLKPLAKKIANNI